jgi:glycerophosphoryl diester phosphodiesterase
VTRLHPFLDHPGVLAFAHRGGAGDWPENTMPAFEGTVALGYRYVETDVHATADGVLVAFHDDALDRVTDRVGAIADLPWSEVGAARVDGEEPIPLLGDILGTWPELRVNIDPKADASVDPLIDVIDRAGALDRVCIGSFSDRRIRRVRRALGDGLCTSPGPGGVALHRGLSSVGRIGRPSVHGCLQVPVRQGPIRIVDESFVETARRRNLQVHVWTIDDPTEMTELLDLGVDGLMTDRPLVLKQVLEDRGDWA